MFNLVYLLRSDPAIKDASLQWLDALDVQLRRVANVTRRTLTFYRETNAVEPVQVCSVLDEIFNAFEAQLKANKITLRVYCQSDETVAGFPGELRHTLANLLTNAIDALASISEERSLNVSVKPGFDWRNPTGKGLRVCFYDNGCGIPDRVGLRYMTRSLRPKDRRQTG